MIDECEYVYVIYPINHLAKALDRTEMTIKNALQELVDTSLLKKKRQGFGTTNYLYVLLPDEMIMKQKENLSGGKLAVSGKENQTDNSKNSSFITDRKLSTNYYSKINNRTTIYEYEEGESLQCKKVKQQYLLE